MRINLVPVDLLSDVHLRAEYREILMAPHYFLVSNKSKSGIDYKKIPSHYTLNKGHAYFWYDKFGYIERRHNELETEMLKREFKTRENNSLLPLLEQIPNVNKNDWLHNKDELYINVERILTRIYEMIFEKNKPNLYKFNKTNMTFLDWCILYTERLSLDQGKVHKIITNLESGYRY